MIFKLFILFILSLPGFCQEEFDEIDEVIRDHQAQTAHLAPVLKMQDDLKAHQERLANVKIADLMDKAVSEQLEKALLESRIRQQNPEFIRAMIMGSSQGKPAGRLFETFPKLLDVSVDVMRDEQALPGLLRILPQKEKVTNYLYVVLGIFVVGLILRYAFIPKDWSFFKRIVASMFLSLGLTAVSLSSFYFYFPSEVGPTVDIFIRHFIA